MTNIKKITKMGNFKKGQTVYKIDLHPNGNYITEETIKLCGKKIISLENRKGMGNKYRAPFLTGNFSNPVIIFHATKEAAEKELKKYESNF